MEVGIHHPSVALIVGVTGMAGLSLAEALKEPTAAGGPWKVYGAARRPMPTWFPASIVDQYIAFDAADADDTRHKLSPICNQVTHVFWVALQVRETEELNISVKTDEQRTGKFQKKLVQQLLITMELYKMKTKNKGTNSFGQADPSKQKRGHPCKDEDLIEDKGLDPTPDVDSGPVQPVSEASTRSKLDLQLSSKNHHPLKSYPCHFSFLSMPEYTNSKLCDAYKIKQSIAPNLENMAGISNSTLSSRAFCFCNALI